MARSVYAGFNAVRSSKAGSGVAAYGPDWSGAVVSSSVVCDSLW